jgi:hypothetical protein
LAWHNFAQSEIIFRHFLHAGSKFLCFQLTATVTENYFIFCVPAVDGFRASTYLVPAGSDTDDEPCLASALEAAAKEGGQRNASCVSWCHPILADDPVPRDGETSSRLLLSNVTQT